MADTFMFDIPTSEAPTSVQVMLLPSTPGEKVSYPMIPLVEVAIPEPDANTMCIPSMHEGQPPVKFKKFDGLAFWNTKETGNQPDVRLLPDVRGMYWNDHQWDDRGVYPFSQGTYHVFYTRSTYGLNPNGYTGNRLFGNVLILKLSDHTEDGRKFYVDLTSQEILPRYVELISEVATGILGVN